MKTFKEFLKLEEKAISNGKPKWDGKDGLSKYFDVRVKGSELKFDYSDFDLKYNDFTCTGEPIKSLEGSPKSCRGFYVKGTKIENLVGSPNKVLTVFECSDNRNLKSLKGISSYIGSMLDCSGCPNLFEVSPILNVKFEDEAKIYYTEYGKDDVSIILNKYKNNPKNLIKMLAELKKIDKRFC